MLSFSPFRERLRVEVCLSHSLTRNSEARVLLFVMCLEKYQWRSGHSIPVGEWYQSIIQLLRK